jgi:hypothetical protein
MPPFLEVLTRCYKRPVMLAANQAGLQAQSSADWQQTLLVDDVGRGVAWANGRLAEYAPDLVGDYIWVLDDDDECIVPTLVNDLYVTATLYAPDVIMLRMDHKERGVLPDSKHWGKPPVRAHIGASAFVISRYIWMTHARAWASGTYDADFEFINAVWQSKPRVYWHDVVASRVQRISRGAPE